MPRHGGSVDVRTLALCCGLAAVVGLALGTRTPGRLKPRFRLRGIAILALQKLLTGVD
jgi:hypothetical protein